MTDILNVSPEEALAQGQEVERFLSSAAGKRLLALQKLEYEQQWKQGKTTEERESAWAKARALEDFVGKASAMMSAGKRVAIEQEREELRKSQKPARRS